MGGVFDLEEQSLREVFAWMLGAERVYRDHTWKILFADGTVMELVTAVVTMLSHAQVGRVLVETQQKGGEVELSYNPAEGAKMHLYWIEDNVPVVRTARDETLQLAARKAADG